VVMSFRFFHPPPPGELSVLLTASLPSLIFVVSRMGAPALSEPAGSPRTGEVSAPFSLDAAPCDRDRFSALSSAEQWRFASPLKRDRTPRRMHDTVTFAFFFPLTSMCAAA